MNWIKIFSLVTTIIDSAKSFFRWISDLLKKREQNKEIDKITEIEKKIEEANQIEDETERLKKKARLANELEKALHPDRNS